MDLCILQRWKLSGSKSPRLPWLPDEEWMHCSQTYSDSKIWHCLHSWFHLFCECKIVVPYFCPSCESAPQFLRLPISQDIAWSSPARLCRTCKWRQQLLISHRSAPLTLQANLPTQTQVMPRDCSNWFLTKFSLNMAGSWDSLGLKQPTNLLGHSWTRHPCRDVGLTSK